MIKRVLFLFLFFMVLANNPVPSFADAITDRMIRNNEANKKRCLEVLESFGKNSKDDMQLKANVLQYRSCYPYLDWYTPFSKDLVDDMTALAYGFDTETDATEKQKKLVEYKRFVKRHIADLAVVRLALTLSKGNPEYGNPAHYQKIKGYLLESIIPPGREEGLYPENAYFVVSYSEEEYVLSKIGGKLLKSEIYKVGEFYYNAHEIENKKTGNVKVYYVDITMIIRLMKEREKIRELNSESKIKL